MRREEAGMNGRIKAYFTLEAAMLFPFVMGALLLVIYFWFFQYDRCLMELDAGALALRGSTCGIGEKEELMKWLIKEEQKIYADKYVAWEKKPMKMKLEKDTLRIETGGGLFFPFREISFWGTDYFWETEAVFENHIVFPVFFVRTCRKITGGE